MSNCLNCFKKFYRKYVSLDDLVISKSKEEIIFCFHQQIKKSGWTFFSERQFVEGLFCTRFNYFIATVSVLSAAITQIESLFIMFLVILVSLILLILMALNIYRAYFKLMILAKIIYKLESFNVPNIIDIESKSKFNKNKLSFSSNPIIGFIIPAICILTYLIMLIWCITNLLTCPSCTPHFPYFST